MSDKLITLGAREFRLRPLKLGELRPLLDALDAVTGNSGGALIDAAVRVVHAGLVGAYPDLRSDDILGLEVTIDELNGAVAAILHHAGLVPKELAPGEGGPVVSSGAADRPNSGPSTPPSPPAAATRTGPSTA